MKINLPQPPNPLKLFAPPKPPDPRQDVRRLQGAFGRAQGAWGQFSQKASPPTWPQFGGWK